MRQVVHRVTEPLSSVYNCLMLSVIWRNKENIVNSFKGLKLCLFFKQTHEVSQIQRKLRLARNFPTTLSPETVDSFVLALAVQRLQRVRRIATVTP